MCKHFVHEPLIRGFRILKTERHHFVTEKALASDEWSFLLISLIHLDLVVTRKSIHEAQQLVSRCEVYTHSPLSVGFLDHHYISQPVEIVYLPNEFWILQFADFFRYSHVSLLGKHSLLLMDRRKRRWYIQPVNYDWRVNPEHVFVALGKDILVLS